MLKLPNFILQRPLLSQHYYFVSKGFAKKLPFTFQNTFNKATTRRNKPQARSPFLRDKYHRDFQTSKATYKIDQETFRIYFLLMDPRIVRRAERQYVLTKQQNNFYLTFVDKIDSLGPEAAWEQRKTVVFNILDIFKLEKLQKGDQLEIQKPLTNQVTGEHQGTRTFKVKMPIEYSEKIAVQIVNLVEQQEWKAEYQLLMDSWAQLMGIAKMNLHTACGLKLQFELMKRKTLQDMVSGNLQGQETADLTDLI